MELIQNNMSETIITYSLDEKDVAIPMNRDEFYNEQIEIFKKNKKPTKAVEIIEVILFNEKGELIVQKRSDTKRHNASLLDKSIGGHIQYGDSPDYTVMVETVQELQIPSIVLRTGNDFKKTYKLLSSYLNTIAIIKHIETKFYNSKRIFDSDEITIANKKNIYMGVYDGAVKTVDMEAKGILFYDLEDLKKELKSFPDIFTNDLHFLMKEYGTDMENFVKFIRS